MLFLCLVLSLLSFGCAGRRPAAVLSPNFYAKASPRVAVLPFENQSVDMLAPGQLQGLVTAGLQLRGYNPAPPAMVQQRLRDIGITDGGQLPGFTPQKLGETLQVDGLFYGTVENFVFQNVGFILRKAVQLRLKLVLASTGETLWEDFGEASNVFVTLDRKQAEDLFAIGMAQRLAQNIMNRPLGPQSQAAVQSLMMKLPSPRARPRLGPSPMPPPPFSGPSSVPGMGPPPSYFPGPGGEQIPPPPPPPSAQPIAPPAPPS